MKAKTLCLPNYTVGEDCYEQIPHFARRLGNKVVLVGGKTALSKAEGPIREALKDSDLEILDTVWYGGDATYENGNKLIANPSIQEADIIFGVGGGRALDTCKYVATELDKPLFNFPTVGSNCASVTAICVFYNEDGSFKNYYYPNLAEHSFINTKIIADSPEELLWAGIGDALSKEVEAVYSSQGQDLAHTPSMGIALSHVCTEPLLKYGKQAIEDIRNKEAGEALEQVVLDIIVSTGLVSNMVSNMPEYYYNSSLAHCVYYASTVTEKGVHHLHGEVVSLGVLCQLLFMGETEMLDKIMDFNSSIGLPVCFDDIEVSPDEFEKMLDMAETTVEWQFKPDCVTRDSFRQMMEELNEYGRKYKADKMAA